MTERGKLDELRNLVVLLQKAGMEQYDGSKLVVRAAKLSSRKKISVITALNQIKESNKDLNSAMEKIDECELKKLESLFV